ncbi:2-hydroxyacyl-CoA dehydratase family protein [Treponema sp. TIM-1]|uniref:2-hydroxyacyl-CoA dehydratase family protein n=1 Tax=Treponema sp. TIM-1 TaxID=2898417 RepID=UPI0039816AA4
MSALGTWLTQGDTRIGSIYDGKMAYRRREWRGVASTWVDFLEWLKLWGTLIAFTMKAPLQISKSFFEYRWMASYLAAPAFVDKLSQGQRGVQHKISRKEFAAIIKMGTIYIADMLKADRKLGGSKKLSKKIVLFDEMTMIQIMAGFPNLTGIPYQLMPVFLLSEIDQLSCIPYIDAIESFGLPSETCPVPTSEAGAAVIDAYPHCGACFISSSMPCDGSAMASSYQSRRFNLPTYHLTFPVRYDDEDTVEAAAEDIKGCIKFIEENTGEKFDWDAYFTVIRRFNEETKLEMERWEINRTPYPQITGATLSLWREFMYQIEGGLHPWLEKVYRDCNKIMLKSYEQKKKPSSSSRYRALVWNCPAHYYANFSSWAENCWGINVLADMEILNFTKMLNTEDQEEAIRDLGRLYERMVMRKHTNGGYAHVLDELWRMVDAFKVDMIFLYQHVACKTLSGLQGLFDDQARERGIPLIWIEHDLMDPRTVSRREMRNKVNNFMLNVFRAEPADPSLVDFDDDNTW